MFWESPWNHPPAGLTTLTPVLTHPNLFRIKTTPDVVSSKSTLKSSWQHCHLQRELHRFYTSVWHISMNASFLLYSWAPWRQVVKITQPSQNGYRLVLYSAYGSVDCTTNCTSVCVFTYGQGHVWIYMQLCIEAKRQLWCYFPQIVHFVFWDKVSWWDRRTRLAGQWIPGILLSISPVLKLEASASVCSFLQLARVVIEGFVLVPQELYQLS